VLTHRCQIALLQIPGVLLLLLPSHAVTHEILGEFLHVIILVHLNPYRFTTESDVKCKNWVDNLLR
jgi:hypothetical protein